MKPKETNEPSDAIFTTGTSISDGESWYSSLIRQLRERPGRKPESDSSRNDHRSKGHVSVG